MSIVILSAIGVGGATVVGALIGFLFRDISKKFTDVIISFAAGIMLSAALFGLLIPAVEYGGGWGIFVAVVGILVGALCINLSDRFVPHLERIVCDGKAKNGRKGERVILLLVAMAVHNLPEGIAAGVGFGSGQVEDAIVIAGGIALHNIPEGMVIIAPMLAAGVSRKRTFLCALMTGLVEVVGTFIGYFAVNVTSVILPFALAFACGAMLYVISGEMIPEAHGEGKAYHSTYAFLVGFCVMLVLDLVM